MTAGAGLHFTNLLLESVVLIQHGKRVRTGSAVFKRSLCCSLLFLLSTALAAGAIFMNFYFEDSLVVKEQVDPTPEFVLGSDEGARFGLSCPCTGNSIIQLRSFAQMSIEQTGWVKDTCAAYKTIVGSDRSFLGAWVVVDTMCNIMQLFVDFDREDFYDGTISSPLALDREQLRRVAGQRVHDLNASTSRSINSVFEFLTIQGTLDGNQALRDRTRLMSVARAACPTCNVSTPTFPLGEAAPPIYDPSSPLYNPFSIPEGLDALVQDDACCWENPKCTVSNISFAEAIPYLTNCEQASLWQKLLCFRFQAVQSMALANSVRWTQFCRPFDSVLRIKMRDLHGMVLLMTSALLGQPEPTSADISHWGHDLKFSDALGRGLLIERNVTIGDGEYSKYFEQCKPKRCSYYTSETGARFLQACALTLAILGPLFKVLKTFFANAVVVVPNRVWVLLGSLCCGCATFNENTNDHDGAGDLDDFDVPDSASSSAVAKNREFRGMVGMVGMSSNRSTAPDDVVMSSIPRGSAAPDISGGRGGSNSSSSSSSSSSRGMSREGAYGGSVAYTTGDYSTRNPMHRGPSL